MEESDNLSSSQAVKQSSSQAVKQSSSQAVKQSYKNYISLGYFCEVAQDLEKLGLRNASSPFDWGISCFANVIDAIDNGFDGFLEYENLSQNTLDRSHYREDKYNFLFFHDFDKYKNLDEQYAKVKEKYWRRIKRFLASIKQPTLFVRYISAEKVDATGKSIELNWIESNYQYVLDTIRKYNPENDIVFIGDETVYSSIIIVYHVLRDEGDKVSRSPIYNNKELFAILSNVQFAEKEKNRYRYKIKDKKRKSYLTKLKVKIISSLRKTFLKEYEHDKTYD